MDCSLWVDRFWSMWTGSGRCGQGSGRCGQGAGGHGQGRWCFLLLVHQLWDFETSWQDLSINCCFRGIEFWFSQVADSSLFRKALRTKPRDFYAFMWGKISLFFPCEVFYNNLHSGLCHSKSGDAKFQRNLIVCSLPKLLIMCPNWKQKRVHLAPSVRACETKHQWKQGKKIRAYQTC